MQITYSDQAIVSCMKTHIQQLYTMEKYKSSAVAEMGDRLATIDLGRKVGAAVPLSVGVSWVPI